MDQRSPVLPFLDCSVFTKENPKFTKEFPSLPNPLKPWKRQGKHPNHQGNSLLKIYQGNPKNQGKEGQGESSAIPPKKSYRKGAGPGVGRRIFWVLRATKPLSPKGPFRTKIAIIRAPYKIQNPSEPQNTPRNTPQIPLQNRNTEKIRKKYEIG